jgi:hypothetical protein
VYGYARIDLDHNQPVSAALLMHFPPLDSVKILHVC